MGDGWEVYVVDEVREWIGNLDDATHARVVQAIDALSEGGPSLGRPLVDSISNSTIKNSRS
ncbi:type II toxin-antitoxin system RelE/ParE family toxin [Actinomadura alba]|nr:type II toxin-antitoxin system RelE/ParE family toxin [Actinomadura alba]